MRQNQDMKAIALKPNHAGAHNNLGEALNELGKLDEAEASYRDAIILTFCSSLQLGSR